MRIIFLKSKGIFSIPKMEYAVAYEQLSLKKVIYFCMLYDCAIPVLVKNGMIKTELFSTFDITVQPKTNWKRMSQNFMQKKKDFSPISFFILRKKFCKAISDLEKFSKTLCHYIHIYIYMPTRVGTLPWCGDLAESSIFS